jgi:hypothetical protein
VDSSGQEVIAGREELRMEPAGTGMVITSTTSAELPWLSRATLEWHLEAGLATRILYLSSSDGFGNDYELELAVTGNGILAHRTGPDGPTQVELGWGPEAELDHLSAAFSAVLVARSGFDSRAERVAETVVIGTEDLVPRPARHAYRLLPGGSGTRRIEHRSLSTGHTAVMEARIDGPLVGYAGLLRLESLELPTK